MAETGLYSAAVSVTLASGLGLGASVSHDHACRTQDRAPAADGPRSRPLLPLHSGVYRHVGLRNAERLVSQYSSTARHRGAGRTPAVWAAAAATLRGRDPARARE